MLQGVMKVSDSSGLDPRGALNIAKRLANRWLRKSCRQSINGMDSDDIAQETMLALLRNGSSLEYAHNKARFVVFDAIRDEAGNRRVGQNSVDMQGSHYIDTMQPSRRDSRSVESLIQAILSSERLSRNAKCIAVMRLEGKSNSQIALMLGVSESRVCQMKSECAKELYEFLGEKMPEALAKHLHHRLVSMKENRKRYVRQSQVNCSLSSPKSPSS